MFWLVLPLIKDAKYLQGNNIIKFKMQGVTSMRHGGLLSALDNSENKARRQTGLQVSCILGERGKATVIPILSCSEQIQEK